MSAFLKWCRENMPESQVQNIVDAMGRCESWTFNAWAEASRQADAQLAAKDAEIAELRRKLSGFDELCSLGLGGRDVGIPLLVAAANEIRSLTRQIVGADRERDESRRLLGELLAVIHRDGGQYQAEHGEAKAVEAGMARVHELRSLISEHVAHKNDLLSAFGRAESERDEARESLKRSEADLLAAIEDRGEARECVKRLCETLTAIRDSTCTSATTLRGHAGVALAATPEHLR